MKQELSKKEQKDEGSRSAVWFVPGAWQSPYCCEPLQFQKIVPSLRTLTYEAERTLDSPAQRAARAQAPGCQSSSCRSVRRGRGRDQYSQQRSSGGEWVSGHPRLFKGEHGEEVRQRFSIVGACPLACSRGTLWTVTIPQYWFNKTKQHSYAFSTFRDGCFSIGRLQAGLGLVKMQVHLAESSLQSNSSISFLCERINFAVVIQTWSWRGKPASISFALLREVNAKR